MERVIVTTLYVADDEKDLIVGRGADSSPTEVTFAWLPQLDPNNIPDISDTWSTKPDKILVELDEFLDQIIRWGRYSPSRAVLSEPSENSILIERIIREPIIIERSPRRRFRSPIY